MIDEQHKHHLLTLSEKEILIEILSTLNEIKDTGIITRKSKIDD